MIHAKESKTAVNLIDLENKLSSINQEHLLAYKKKLSRSCFSRLCNQISNLDFDFFNYQKKLIFSPRKSFKVSPLKNFTTKKDLFYLKQTGCELLQSKKAACVILAGGQGSRLKFDGPKGLFPVSPVKKKTLFQLVAEKVKAASSLVKQDLPVAFMLSPLNVEKTLFYFRSKNFFGLKEEQIDFFCQPLWPLLDFEGNLFLENKETLSMGPNGNGCISRCLYESPIWKKWKDMGIEMLSIIPIDNPLALPFDTELFAFHSQENNDVSIKSCFRLTPEEDVGVLATSSKTNKTVVVEYSELSREDRYAFNDEHKLKYSLANIGLYCFSMDFIEKTAKFSLPIHKVKKYVKKIKDKKINKTTSPNSWKFEEFIFDLFSFADKCGTLVYPRHECFAPLKNLEGEHSVASVREAVSLRERELFQQVTGKKLSPNAKFELDADFYYYPSNKNSSFWENKAFFEESFIEAS